MLKRLYISNFRNLVNFEFTPSELSLLLGPNGAGKSSVLDVLAKLRAYIIDNGNVSDTFPPADFNRWHKDNEIKQLFELDIAGHKGLYRYRLVTSCLRDTGQVRMEEEELRFQDKPLFHFTIQDGQATAQLYRDGGIQGPEMLANWSISGVGFLQPRKDNTQLVAFRERLARLFVVKLNPEKMAKQGSETIHEAHHPAPDLSNFASWYLHLLQESNDKVFHMTKALKERLPGFVTLALVSAGERKVLKAKFRFSDMEREVLFGLNELSDGQRATIVLHAFLHCLPDADVTLCVDEPENYLALPEIQPWLDAIYDRVEDDRMQALIVSHHPRLINMLTNEGAFWIQQDPNVGLARIKPITAQEGTLGLPVSQLVERGWIYDA